MNILSDTSYLNEWESFVVWVRKKYSWMKHIREPVFIFFPRKRTCQCLRLHFLLSSLLSQIGSSMRFLLNEWCWVGYEQIMSKIKFHGYKLVFNMQKNEANENWIRLYGIEILTELCWNLSNKTNLSDLIMFWSITWSQIIGLNLCLFSSNHGFKMVLLHLINVTTG